MFEVKFDRSVYQRFVHDGGDWEVAEDYLKRLRAGQPVEPLAVRLFTEYRIASERRVKRVRPEVGDVLAAVFLMSPTALSALNSVLDGCGVSGPTKGGGDWTAFLPTTVLDVLNEERSEIRRFPSTNRIMELTHPVINRNGLRDVGLFQLHDIALRYFATSRFFDAYTNAGLTGLTFNECELVE